MLNLAFKIARIAMADYGGFSVGEITDLRYLVRFGHNTGMLGWVFLALTAGCNPPKKPAKTTETGEAGSRQSQSILIVSGSMEPCLPGPTRHAVCPRCGKKQAFCSSAIDVDYPVRCWHCGQYCTWESSDQSPDTIALLTISDEANYPIRVGEAIGFRSDEMNEVKRIAGLPGDGVEVRSGDLWVNGQRHQKTAIDFLQQAILVHADERESTTPTKATLSGSPHQWLEVAGEAMQTWTPATDLDFLPTKIDIFQPGRWTQFEGKPQREHCVLGDDWWFNSGEHLAIQPVTDFGVVLEFAPSQPRLRFAVWLWGEEAIYRIQCYQEPDTCHWQISHWNQQTWVLDAKFHETRTIPHQRLTCARVDGRLLIAEDQEVFAIDLASSNGGENSEPSSLGPWLNSLQPIAIAVADSPCLRRQWVVRDRYYRMSSRHANGVICQPNSTTGYTLLGDNVSVSADSRTRWPMGVERDSILGRIQVTPQVYGNLERQARLLGLP